MSALDGKIQAVADLIVSKLEQIDVEWQQPWVNAVRAPCNLSGRMYSGSNELLLSMHANKEKFAAPVYLTFLQARSEGLQVLKGGKSFPIFYRDAITTDKENNRIKSEDYKLLSGEEKSGL